MNDDYRPMFWSLTTTEMSQEQATRMAAVIEAECPGVRADAVDPSAFFALSLDRWTTELLKDALVALRDRGGDPGGLLEDVEAWLSHQAKPYEPDAGPGERYEPVAD